MPDKVKRYLILVIGLFVNSLGVALITLSRLGTSPISSVPYVLSLKFAPTLGNFTIIVNVILVLIQIVILKKRFKLEYLLQIPAVFIFGYFIDWCMMLFHGFQPEVYGMKILGLLIGCLILGFGVYLEVLANAVMLPGESVVRAIVLTKGTEFGITKIFFDVTLALSAVVLSFLFFHSLKGVREGTIISALLVGFIARRFGKWLSFLPGKIYKNLDK